MVKKNILAGCICFLLICFFSTNAFAQPQKNILRIWFDTITVKKLPAQVVMNCWYKIEGNKPHDFRGFQMPFIYEAHQITPYGYYFSGTACENAGFHVGNHDSQTGTGSVVVLGATELDLRKPLLFSVAYIALPRLNDTIFNDFIGLTEVDRKWFELSLESGIDSVVITDGWIKYAKTLPPQPEKRASISIATDTLFIEDDSSGWVSLRTTLVDSARVKRCVFSFSTDSAIFSFDTAVIGSAFASIGSVSIENKNQRVNIYVTSNVDTARLVGFGELMKMKFTAKKREDTVIVNLRDSAFFALNIDNLLDTVGYDLSPLVINGSKEVIKTVSRSIGTNDFTMTPNPAVTTVTITSARENANVEIYSILGEKVYNARVHGAVSFDVRGLPSGWYQVLVYKEGKADKALLLVQH